MKLASLDDGTRDGRLLVVSRDRTRIVPARAATTMQDALDRWAEVEASLRSEAADVEQGGEPLDPARLLAAMPRSYQFLDGSAFLAHNHILANAWGYERRTLADPPLIYQGLSDRFYPPHGPVPFREEADNIDFEAEFAVVTDHVPMGIDAAAATAHVRLLVLLNDWSLRAYGPGEMKGGFGFLQAKPPSSMSAIAVTPDELGDAWTGGRLHARLRTRRGDELFGDTDGAEMSYDFGRLLAHAAHTRELCAGTVMGSGTVANVDAAARGSGCIAERRALDELAGRAVTPFLRFGERVRLECHLRAGESPFGEIDSLIEQAS